MSVTVVESQPTWMSVPIIIDLETPANLVTTPEANPRFTMRRAKFKYRKYYKKTPITPNQHNTASMAVGTVQAVEEVLGKSR